MASTMIHYAVSKKIAEQINVSNIDRFYLGALILPDTTSHTDGTYNKSHFQGYLPEQLLKGPNWRTFGQKYGDLLDNDSTYLGYWCHLMEDAMWVHDIVEKHVRIYPREERSIYYQKGYNDYIRLNYLLKKEYNLKPPSLTVYNTSIEEAKESMAQSIINSFICQFDAEICDFNDLEFYSWDVITGYIEKCADFCVNEIKTLRNGKEGVNPEVLYVPK